MARDFVRPDLCPNCLQRLSADDTSRQRVKIGVVFGEVNCIGFLCGLNLQVFV